jgi:hypothetical protein
MSEICKFCFEFQTQLSSLHKRVDGSGYGVVVRDLEHYGVRCLGQDLKLRDYVSTSGCMMISPVYTVPRVLNP